MADDTVPPDGERQPLLAESRANVIRVETPGNDLGGASTGKHQGPTPVTQEPLPRVIPQEPSAHTFQPLSRGKILENISAARFETATSSQDENSDLITSTVYSKKLKIPNSLPGIATHTEDTSVSPSSIHSSGWIRLPQFIPPTEDGGLLGVGENFVGDQPRHHEDNTSDQTDEYLEPARKLEDQLLDELIEWPKGENRFFIPIDQQKRLVTAQSIKEELQRVEEKRSQLPDKKLMDVAEKIWLIAPKLFSILVCLGKSRSIFDFLEEGLDDDALPFVRSLSRDNVSGTGASRFKLSSRQTPQEPIKSMKNWSRNDITGFGRDQWWMLAPVFKESQSNPRMVRHYELDDMCVMPFIEDYERTDTTVGGFSTVWAVRIHPAHQLWNTTHYKNPNPLIALKRLNSTDEKTFRLEVEMLKAFSNHKDQHLIKLYATYKIKNRYHLMFPYCKYNLRTYWEANPEPKFNYINVAWFLLQCRGIAHGLMSIHEYMSSEAETESNMTELVRNRHAKNFAVNPISVERNERTYGRHGDIKPENILWSDEIESNDGYTKPQELEQMGHLVIADFGLMDFHGNRSRSVATADRPATITYAPPERRLRIAISRAYDIWSLGCVYLEFVTWLVVWLEELRRFPEARGLTDSSGYINDDTFYTIIEEKDCPPRAIVRESVTEWMKDLHEKARCSQFIHDFVNLISEAMLVVDQNARIHSGPLKNRLMEMWMRSRADPSYLIDPKPYPARNLTAKDINSAGRFAGGKDAISPPSSPTVAEGKRLTVKNEIPVGLDTTSNTLEIRAAIPRSRPSVASSVAVKIPRRKLRYGTV